MFWLFALLCAAIAYQETTVETPAPSSTPDYSHEGEITKNGVISICVVVAFGILLIIVGVACFHKKKPVAMTDNQKDPLIP